jgi:hypothetical protein
MRTLLRILFGGILAAMLAVTGWASSRKPLWNAWGDVSDPWSLATLADAYAGFLTFFVWVAYKETRLAMKALWFLLILAFGNIAMSVYVLRELARLSDRPLADLLVRKNP